MQQGTTRVLPLYPLRPTTPSHHAMMQHAHHPPPPSQVATLASSHAPSHAHGGGARSLVPTRVTAQRQLQRATRAVKRSGGHPPLPAGRGGYRTAALSRTSSILSMVGARRGVDGAGAWRGAVPATAWASAAPGCCSGRGRLGCLWGVRGGCALGPCAAARLLHPRARQCPPASLPRAGRRRHTRPPSPRSRGDTGPADRKKRRRAPHTFPTAAWEGGRQAPGGVVAPRQCCLPAVSSTKAN